MLFSLMQGTIAQLCTIVNTVPVFYSLVIQGLIVLQRCGNISV